MTQDATTALNDPNAVTGAQSAAADGAPAHPVSGETPLLRLRNVFKSFGAVQALKGVDLDIAAGQVTALVGDNGAGKSTLIKIISGIYSADEGEFTWQGEPAHIRGPRDAAELGIQTVYQDLALCDNLDIVQNMYLGHEALNHGFLDEPSMELTAKSTLAGLSVTTVRSIRQPVGALSGGQRQAVAVARAVMSEAKLVIMDEPTAALGVAQTAMVLDLIAELSRQGIAVLLISHNLNDVFAVSDRIAVLYLGRMAAAGPATRFDTQSTVEWITTGAAAQNAKAAT
jgi:ABC-type sugar transport system ATPase subunit